jgi:hypothetical protein
MPTTRIGRIALFTAVAFGVLWLGMYALEAWARMPVSTLNTKIFVMISYTYFVVIVGVISGIMALVAKFRYADTSRILWVPIVIVLFLLFAVVRSLLFS